MTQYFFNDLYFNLLLPGLSSTTWTWEGLKKYAHDGKRVILDWEIDLASKLAKETRFDSEKNEYVYTGKESQLK